MRIVISTLPGSCEDHGVGGFVRAVWLHSVSGKQKPDTKLEKSDIETWPRHKPFLLARTVRVLASQGATRVGLRACWRELPPWWAQPVSTDTIHITAKFPSWVGQLYPAQNKTLRLPRPVTVFLLWNIKESKKDPENSFQHKISLANK